MLSLFAVGEESKGNTPDDHGSLLFDWIEPWRFHDTPEVGIAEGEYCLRFTSRGDSMISEKDAASSFKVQPVSEGAVCVQGRGRSKFLTTRRLALWRLKGGRQLR